ncbi:MAG TPA: hypothetical protein VGE77_14375 [Nocardioides sp.]
MAPKNVMSFWDAVEMLSDRGRPVAPPRQPVRSLSFPVAIVSLTTLAVAALPLLLLSTDRFDGLPMLLSLFLFPMVAGGLITELVALCRLRRQEPHWTLLWWPLVVLPAGLLGMSVGPMRAHPDYFEATDVEGAAEVLLTFAFLIALGLGLSTVLWMLVVLPLRVLGLAAYDALRGERVAAFRVSVPLVLLAVPTVSLVVVASLGDVESSRSTGGTVVLALLGVPGDYEIVWEPGLVLVRGIVLVLIGSAIWASVRSRRTAREG